MSVGPTAFYTQLLVHRSPSAPRARPVLLTPPPDFKTEDLRIPPSDLTAGLPWGKTTVRRKGSSHKTVTCVTINGGSNRETVNENVNSAIKRHKTIVESTDETIHIPADKTVDGVKNSENERIELIQFSADVDTNSTEESTGKSAERNQRPKETLAKRTADPVAKSVKRAQSDTGESSNRIPALIRESVNCESADKIQYSGADCARECDNRIEDPTVHSVTTFRNSAGQSAKRRQDSTRELGKKSQDNSTRQNVYRYLEGKAWPVQGSAGYKVGTESQSCCKGLNKTQRRESEEGRKSEGFASETNSRTCEKARGIDTADRIERKVRNTACHKDNIKGICSEEFRKKTGPGAIQTIEDSSGDEERKALDHADVKEDYTASEKRKRAHSSGAKTKQVENPASEENKAVQQSSIRKVKRTDSRPVSSEKNKRNGLKENKNTASTPAGSNDENGQDSAQDKIEEAEDFTTGEEQVALQGTMSRRPQVMKITDSATTACRPRTGKIHVSCWDVNPILTVIHLLTDSCVPAWPVLLYEHGEKSVPDPVQFTE